MNNKTTAFNIWYEKIRPVIEKYASNYDVTVDSAYELLHLYSASCMIIQYCFESTTHKKMDPDLVCELYATIFNSALDGYLTSPLNKTIKSIISKNTTITKEILDELKTETFTAMAKSLGLLTHELINIVDETIKLSIFRSKYKPESHNIDYEYITETTEESTMDLKAILTIAIPSAVILILLIVIIVLIVKVKKAKNNE